MNQRNNRAQPRQKRLYSRATVVVVNDEGNILLVNHNREDMWALPGGQIYAGEEPERRAVLEVAEETGLSTRGVEYVGRYAGSVASHTIFFARAFGSPEANRREVQAAVWWDRKARLDVQQHVNAILAMVGDPLEAPAEEGLSDPGRTKGVLHFPRALVRASSPRIRSASIGSFVP